MRTILGKIFGALACWIVAGLCGLGVYGIIKLILNGISSSNWLMVIAGGILGYVFGIILAVGMIAFVVLGLIVLGD